MTILKELYQYREMIRSLIHRDIRGRYKGSVLGFLWTFINPLMQLIVYTIVFSSIMRMGIDKYYLFLFVALIPWIFFSSSLIVGANCIIDNVNLVTKIYFPREVLPISTVTAGFINMLYSFLILLPVVLLTGDHISLIAWLFLPLIAITEYFIVLGLTLVFSAITVYLRDVAHILGIVTMAWQFLTPVMYPIDLVPEKYMGLFMLNPMTPVIIAFRDILYYGKVPELMTIGHTMLFAVALTIVGFMSFGYLKKGFAEEI